MGKVIALFTMGNSYCVPRGSPYFQQTQALRQVGWGIGPIARSGQGRSVLDVVVERVCPAAQLGFGGVIVSNPGGTLAAQQMLINQYESAKRDAPWLVEDRVEVARALGGAFGQMPWYYVGFPDPLSIAGYQQIASMPPRALNRLRQLMGSADPRAGMYAALIDQHLAPWLLTGAKLILDNCTGRWTSQGTRGPEWQTWWAQWAIDHAQVVAGIEPYWQQSVPALWGLPAVSTSENQQRIDAGLASDWARPAESIDPSTLTVLCNATNPALPGPQLVSWTDRPAVIQAMRAWAYWHLSRGRNVAIGCDDFVKQHVDVLEWIDGKAALV